MKLLGLLLITLALSVGALSASIAYHAPLDAPDLQLLDATLADDAGARWVEEAPPDSEESKKTPTRKLKPLVEKGTKITAEVLRKLRDNSVEIDGRTVQTRWVRVKEFSFARWRGKWFFLASMAVMVIGALLLRKAAARPSGGDQPLDSDAAPLTALRAVGQELEKLNADLKATDDPEKRRQRIVDAVQHLQATHLADFVEARHGLARRRGMGLMAEVMDGFASAERQINRAWTIASDGYEEEARECLTLAATLLKAPLEKLEKADGNP